MHDRTSAKQRDSHKLLSSMGLGWTRKKSLCGGRGGSEKLTYDRSRHGARSLRLHRVEFTWCRATHENGVKKLLDVATASTFRMSDLLASRLSSNGLDA